MKWQLIVGLLIVVFIIGSGVFYFLSSDSSSTTNLAVTEDQLAAPSSEETVSPTNAYQAYTKEVLALASGNKRVLFFYANWCPTCRPADANFRQNLSKIPTGITLIRVNYNDTETSAEERELAQKYGVTYQHTFVQIDSQGMQISKWNGGQIEELLANLK